MNPWLAVPLEDYEAHMRSERVRQLDALSELFGIALERRRPESVAILGVAGGNGLERVDCAVIKRIVGLDINPAYLEETRRRFAGLPNLELYCVNLEEDTLALAPVQLAHAALIFEHAGAGRCLDNAISMVADGGVLSVVLQLPGESEPDVGETGRASIRALAKGFALIEPSRLVSMLAARGFRTAAEERRQLAGGKGFWMGVFERVTPPRP